MTLDVDDDHWPSLAPIRTSHAYGTIRTSSKLQQEACTLQAYEDGGACCANVSSKNRTVDATSCMPMAASIDACSPSQPVTDTDLARRSTSCCHTRKKTCIDFFSCFSCCTKPTSSPCPQRRCTPICLRKNGPVRRSMAFLSPVGGLQSFYSSPTGKAAQLSGAFPHTLSTGKLQCYASPRTPGKIQNFSSPWTAGSGNLQCLSAPRTPASGKVQHFSGAIPSPRTPFGSGAASPSSARHRRKSSFSLFMPPNATADKSKKAADHQQLDEPTSPQVTCMGRVRRQTHCKKPHYKDIINSHARKKGAHSTQSCSDSGLWPHTISISNSEGLVKSIAKLSTIEACKQKFGRNQLHNLHKIHGFGDECDNANNLMDQATLDCNQEDDIIPIANGNANDLMYPDSQNLGRQCLSNNLECIDAKMSRPQEANCRMSENIRMCTIVPDGSIEFAEYDEVELTAADTLAMEDTTCNQTTHDLQQEAHDQSQCLELQYGVHQSQCQSPNLQLNTSTTLQPIDPCLLLIRSNSSKKTI